jgi:hypothetical protein
MDGLWDIERGYYRSQGRDEGRLHGRNGGRTHEREGDYCIMWRVLRESHERQWGALKRRRGIMKDGTIEKNYVRKYSLEFAEIPSWRILI